MMEKNLNEDFIYIMSCGLLIMLLLGLVGMAIGFFLMIYEAVKDKINPN